MMSRPSALSSSARAVMAMVGEGLMRARASERKAMGRSGLQVRAGGVLGCGPGRSKAGGRRSRCARRASETPENRLRRLRLRSWRRGIREMDLILGALRRRARSPGWTPAFSKHLTCYCRKTIMISIGGSPEAKEFQRGTRKSSDESARDHGMG